MSVKLPLLLLLLAASPSLEQRLLKPNIPPGIISKPLPFFLCGSENGACCTPPFVPNPVYGPLVACNPGLGCDIRTNTCVKPCGGNNQVCCDGSDTRALKWNKNGVYSPTSPFLKEMCNSGVCDKESHRCGGPCGNGNNVRCCPPDGAQATARCFGDDLECKFDDISYTSGTCFKCGGENNPPCRGECAQGMVLVGGVCMTCGGANQVKCDSSLLYPCNYGCKNGLAPVNGICRVCGGIGQTTCLSAPTKCPQITSRCGSNLGVKNGLCAACGNSGQTACDSGCFSYLGIKNGVCSACGRDSQQPCDNNKCFGTLQVVNGKCGSCGGTNKPPCPKGGCNYPLRLLRGLCSNCGKESQVPCDSGCETGSLLQKGKCSRNCGKDGFLPCDGGCRDGLVVSSQGICSGPTQCATLGQQCVTGNFGTAGTGLTCCSEGGPYLCVFGKCQKCIPHGESVPLGQGKTQICCDRDDFVVADGLTGQKCDVPDADDPK